MTIGQYHLTVQPAGETKLSVVVADRHSGERVFIKTFTFPHEMTDMYKCILEQVNNFELDNKDDVLKHYGSIFNG